MRQRNPLIYEWWRSIDQVSLGLIFTIALFSLALVAVASPAVAERIGLDGFYFLKRHVIFLGISLTMVVAISFLPPNAIRRLAIMGLFISLLLVIYTLVAGDEIKGARRWISLAGISLQPSEFLKPCFIVVAAWILAYRNPKWPQFPAIRCSLALYVLIAVCLALQPDIGMLVTISTAYGVVLFLAGLPLIWVGIAGAAGMVGMSCAYFFLPHVTRRINSFLDPSTSDNYQVSRSLEAFEHGGFFGVGPGEGTVKQFLPDSHTDFIFAVMGEEFGIFSCLLLVGIYATIVIRGILLALRDEDLFTLLAATGLLMLFGIQAFINIGVSINILPTKGMTLPFVSYGGSSLFAVALTTGMFLALTRKRYGVLHFTPHIDRNIG